MVVVVGRGEMGWFDEREGGGASLLPERKSQIARKRLHPQEPGFQLLTFSYVFPLECPLYDTRLMPIVYSSTYAWLFS